MSAVPRLWNHSDIQHIREIQTGQTYGRSGCDDCAYQSSGPYQGKPYFTFSSAVELSEKQTWNLELAKEEFEKGIVKVRSLPLRYFIFFGYNCNLECKMCIQVPKRKLLDEEIETQLFSHWKAWFPFALTVDCIGGEPFSIPSAIQFMREFVEDPELDMVRLGIFTNGIMVDKHLDWLRKKERVSFKVSLDSVGDSYEAIRFRGDWERVSENLVTIRKLIDDEKPQWGVSTNALMMLSGIESLPEFAAFHVQHRIRTSFYSLSYERGNEEILYSEDIVQFPYLTDRVPLWRERFDEAIEIFASGDYSSEAEGLRVYRDMIVEARSQVGDVHKPTRTAASHDRDGIRDRITAYRTIRPEDLVVSEKGFGFDAPDNDSGVLLELDTAELDPMNGFLTIRMTWQGAIIPKHVIRCQPVVHEAPGYDFLGLEKRQEGDTIIKDVYLRASGGEDTAAQSLQFRITSVRPDEFSLLPDRLDILVA
ncbi:radical SAM protein [Magnetospira sp. QH-2]|uniref:radical SAM protein n=1 Tax=Magnetospira sp. (strain QH-2) TaxID=1288970 RepID=UPI003528FCA1